MKKLLSKKGLVLTEVLIALAVLASMIIVLSNIIGNGIGTTKLSKGYLIAQNLVTEGIEMVKIIRDSNWLLVPSKKECWLTIEPGLNLGEEINNINCNALGKAEVDNNYVPEFKNNRLISLGELSPLNLSPNNDESANQKAYKLHRRNIGNAIVYENDTALNNPSNYFRSIKFLNPTDNDVATFEVKVQWMDGRKARTLSVRERLYNYL